MRDNVLSTPVSPSDLPNWLCRMAEAWGGSGMPVVLDVSRSSWCRVPGEISTLLTRLGVDVEGLYTGTLDRSCPPNLKAVEAIMSRAPWMVCSEKDMGRISSRMRGGQVYRFDGDVLVDGDVSPGAEISAGGSVYVRGAIKGRVCAGQSASKARIICESLFPELVSVGEFHVAGDRITGSWWGAPAMISLNDGRIRIDNPTDEFLLPHIE